MRILHVITSLDRGGSEGYLAQLAPRLASLGIEQRVISLTAGGVNASILRDSDIQVDDLGMERGMPHPRGLVGLRRIIRQYQPDGIQSWLYHANVLSSLALLASGCRQSTWIAWGIRSAEMDVSRYGFGLRAIIWASRRLSGQADQIVVNSHTGLRDHQRLGFAADRMCVIPNGVNTERFIPDSDARKSVRQEFGIADTSVLAGVFARNDPMKDIAGIRRALERQQHLEILFVGTGTETLPSARHCHLVGERSDVPRLMAGCDFTILGSVSEGFPNVVAESLAAGTPVVSTDAGDARDIVGPCGHIVPVKNPKALGRAMAEMIALSPKRRADLGRVGRTRMLERFEIDTSVRRFAQVYDALTHEKATRRTGRS